MVTHYTSEVAILQRPVYALVLRTDYTTLDFIPLSSPFLADDDDHGIVADLGSRTDSYDLYSLHMWFEEEL